MKIVKLLPVLVLYSGMVFGQTQAPENWFNLDPKSDKVWGVSTEKVYKELKVDKNKEKIIVAVIDGGTDYNHEDLKSMIWVNKDEIPGNGIDDDKNGYIDDVYGWNFIGGKNGNVDQDTYEFTRILSYYIEKGYPAGKRPAFSSTWEEKQYDLSKKIYDEEDKETRSNYEAYQSLNNAIRKMIKRSGSENPSMEEVKAIHVNGKGEEAARNLLLLIVQTGGVEKSPINIQFKEAEEQLSTMVNYNLNLKFNPRDIVGDNYEDLTERYYGNNNVDAAKPLHGTHVAGIIAADRNNNTGISGICQMAEIMIVRVVPNGDERDKDVANAIIYAVDNGAKVINMSFGKRVSPHPELIEKAIQYALSKDVLLIHAAGNDGTNIDETDFYPIGRINGNPATADNWIEVGALSWQKGKKRVASFSNYGKNQVDFFAPGVDLNSTVPGNEYKNESGTSMAAPVVAGVAALIRQNYPTLTAAQTKKILSMSVIKCKERVTVPGKKKRTRMKKLCRTGGVVNAYQALILAEKVASGEVILK